ncbi:hypothetical protein B0T26DRAFT_652264 [Lasiosphaeria miniovina]|uniref:Zinc finger Mcm10/DnaG-type domain-containing protein n=1 Tax=Lasiosphaeria miniovina TaxID=1954250 RepID=A0AA40A5L8_9PEZI|nr:uncharacterized protein B0T26DRAFT_652264 [Lasiosphaeria miniovina]KAK0709573.1 hypothetical protein B0T26DRAFT_652264 [Lasiosphaeria miniovina]
MASQWPPRSPHDVLLGTPGGRERLRRMAERKSPTPSPSRLRSARSHSTLNSRSGGPGLGADMDNQLFDGGDDDDDDEDDEETLQLKLQAIQARLKLKKLQSAKAQKKASAVSDPGPASAAVGMREVPLQSKLAAVRDRMEGQPVQTGVQVPASPVRKAQSSSNLQTSPHRVLLGIDKGLRAADVSLRRAPSVKAMHDDRSGQPGGYLRRSKTPLPAQVQQADAPRPLSFNERLSSARSEESARQERQQRIQKIRTKAFSVGKQEMEEYKTKALDIPDRPYKPQEFTRNDILSSTGAPLQRSSTVPSLRSAPALDTGDESIDNPSLVTGAPAGSGDSEASFEPYSGLHLSKRILPHQVLTRAITGKKTYVLQDLLRHVKAPDWSLPDIESDVVVFAIIASKSDPRSHRPGPGGAGKAQQDRGKYMVLTLVDLAFEVELFLFNTGFDRFWKMTVGAVLAILNPNILPPPPGREATGRFGLVINSDEDTILEIGNARDIGYCKSVKKDGQFCNTWVNARRSEYCEFHTNEALQRTRHNRMELNGSSFGGKRPNSKEAFDKKEEDRRKAAMGNYDRATQSRFFISGGRRGAAEMMDDDGGGVADRVEREEGLKRRLAQKERERDIAKRLGEIGGGAGKDGSALQGDLPPKWDARALGLVGRRGAEQPKIDLGPIKRKRPDSSASNSTATGGGGGSGSAGGGTQPKIALGWGSSLTKKLGRMKEGEHLDGTKNGGFSAVSNNAPAAESIPTATATATSARNDRSPVRKKTRFVTEKGIREAGRESLGEPLSAAAAAAKIGRRRVIIPNNNDDDDDDDLIIIK